MKRMINILILLMGMALAAPSHALDINLVNINSGSPDQQKLASTYGQAYGYPPQQVAPVLNGPAEEVPTILRISQAAGTVPTTVWMMRRMGMSYSNILSSFALAPAVLAGAPAGPSPYGYQPGYGIAPGWLAVNDPLYIQMGRIAFLQNVMKVDPRALPYIPAWGNGFSYALLHPYNPVYGTWLPPGIAKKYGLWIPPGQAKKMGWFPGGPGWKGDKHGWKHGHGGWGDEDFNHQGWDKKGNHGGPHHGFEGEEGGDNFHGKGSHGPNGHGKDGDLASKGKGSGSHGHNGKNSSHGGKGPGGGKHSPGGNGGKGKGRK